MNSKNLGKVIVERLSKVIDLSRELFVVNNLKNPFEILVAIILSQNTSDKNSIKALMNLKQRIPISPEGILSLSDEELEALIKPGGLYKEKAKRLKELAKILMEKISLEDILKKPTKEARKILLSLPGIGKKTADVFLAIYGKDTIGVDTHAARVSKRLGIAPEKGGYETIRSSLMKTFRGLGNYDTIHKYLIAHGRRWCKAKNPLCDVCPLNDLCKYHKKQR